MAHAYMMGMAERERRIRRSQLRRSHLRKHSNPWDIPEGEFVANYRLSLPLFQQLVDELAPYLRPKQRSTGISTELKIMAALDFYAGGSYQRRVGKDYNLGLCQTAVHKCVAEVTDALNQSEVLLRHIKFPSSTEERRTILKGFMDVFGFPGVVGCIDGTHIAIIRPHLNEEAFFNRKHYHSLNALIICDVNLNILHVDASYGGACHDSHVWNRSALEAHMQSLNEAGEACWLLGDSGYAQRNWMMTPILRTAPDSPESNYTDNHTSTRNTVERCIGVLKARWRCLLAHRTLHYDPIKAGKIVNACIVLHNMCNNARLDVPALDEYDRRRDGQRQPRQPAYAQDVVASRQALVERLWRDRRRRR
ncbi:putative nuclease HARBI1 [Maniola jurtina]|uniref:putative nuclease HARBI1 n=1 Tax=Maniola jurtina TaxID=191418 RepID=UPI001E68BB8A|nr:putative nuclease HARBI1 [Maniola jurtina]